MSVPLKVISCAATMTLALAPGIAEAQAAEKSQAAKLYGKQHQRAQSNRLARTGLHNQQVRASLNAHLLAGLQRSVRLQRARLVARWQRQANRAVRFAVSQRGVPYRWGGTGRGGYDCSGLVQRAWRRAGIQIPRVTYDQYRRIRTRVAGNRLRPGDLVLFNRLGHVGMYVGTGRFVHSPRPGRHVTTEPLSGYWKGRVVGAVRPGWPRLPEIPTALY